MDIQQIKLLLYWAGVVIFLLFELKLSYREPTVSKLKRWITNLPLSVVNGVIYNFIYLSVIVGLLKFTTAENMGLLNTFDMPYWLKFGLGILILDFSIYIWHMLTHVVPFLWRFHRVHHSDMNMDVSTANRFHIGELVISGLVRLAVIYTFGIPLMAYFVFEIMVNLAIEFHHSSIKMNPTVEGYLSWVFMPPFLHRIHHSVKIRERDSNYGVIFTFWDRMLGSLTTGVDQSKIVIGIGSHRKFERLGFWHLLIMPLNSKSR